MKTFMCSGYVCDCGETVTVFRYLVNVQYNNPPTQVTVSCPNGHSRTVRIEQMGQLTHWTETELEPGEQTSKIQ